MQIVPSASRPAYDVVVLSTRVPSVVIDVLDELARKRKKNRSDVIRDLLVRSLSDRKLVQLADDRDYRL